MEVKSGSTLPLNREGKVAQLVDGILPLLPALGIIPGGPVVGAIGRVLVEELDMPEIAAAFADEQRMQQEMKNEQKQVREQQAAVEAGIEGAKAQIKAEQVAAKQVANAQKARRDEQNSVQ